MAASLVLTIYCTSTVFSPHLPTMLLAFARFASAFGLVLRLIPGVARAMIALVLLLCCLADTAMVV